MMPARIVPLLLMALAAGAGAAELSLEQLKAEPNLERRAEKCWHAADRTLAHASKLQHDGDFEESRKRIDLMMEIVELGYRSLQETGKDPRRASKPFKRAEQSIARLTKRLRGVLEGFSFEEREELKKYLERLDELHSILLRGIFGLR